MNIDELERHFIRSAQRELAPSAADRERNQAAVLERLAAEPHSGTSAVGGGAAGQSARSMAPGVIAGVIGARGSRLGMLGVGLIVGAMAGGWFGYGLGRTAGDQDDGSLVHGSPVPGNARGGVERTSDGPPAVVAAPPAPPGVAFPAADAESEPGGAEPAAEGASSAAVDRPLAHGADAEAARRRGLAAAKSRSARGAPPAVPQSSLAAELAMLQRARRALNAENGLLALGIVQELDERFPKGVLVEERNATRILSLCQLERVAEARNAARDFLGRYPSSVYAERVRESCASGSSD